MQYGEHCACITRWLWPRPKPLRGISPGPCLLLYCLMSFFRDELLHRTDVARSQSYFLQILMLTIVHLSLRAGLRCVGGPSVAGVWPTSAPSAWLRGSYVRCSPEVTSAASDTTGGSGSSTTMNNWKKERSVSVWTVSGRRCRGGWVVGCKEFGLNELLDCTFYCLVTCLVFVLDVERNDLTHFLSRKFVKNKVEAITN